MLAHGTARLRQHLDGDAGRLRGQRAVSRPKWQAFGFGHRDVARIVSRHIKRLSNQPRGAASHRIHVESHDVVAVEHAQPGLNVRAGGAPLADGPSQSLHYLLEEIRRGESFFAIGKPVFHVRKWFTLVGKVQRHGCAGIDGETHLRPSWISWEMVSLGWPLRFNRTLATRCRHWSVSRRESRPAGTTRATGLLWRVMVVPKPRLARETSSQNCSLAWAIVFVITI